MRVFAIVSWGCTATAWLARALNSHPDAFVAHAANSEWSYMHGQPPVDPIRYLELLEVISSGYQLVGDVHGIDRQAIPRISEFFGSRFAAAVLVREPLARLRSQFAVFDEFAYSRWPTVDYVDTWADSFGMDPDALTARDRCYLHGINMLNAITEEMAVGPIHRMEDLTTSQRAFGELVSHVSGDAIDSPRSWVKAALRTPRSNMHATKGPSVVGELLDVSVQGHALPELLRTMVSPDAWSAYEDLGYGAARRLLEG